MKIRFENIKPLEENIVGKLLDIGLGSVLFCFFFLDLEPKVKASKAKINKWDYIKLKSFFTGKKTINRMKRQPLEWEKIFAIHVSKILISKMYTELIQFNNNKNI